ncbi:MAG: hypothetical protein P8163_00065 [Candidatus Thiodiazotropha sp.]
MVRWLVGLLFFYVGYTASQEHPGCRNLPLSDPGVTSAELLAIAQSCESPQVADLYFHRAQHIRLLKKYAEFERGLQHFSETDDSGYVESYRMHIALVEVFSSHDLLTEKRDQTLHKLNKIYEQSQEIAELRFKGYDLIADRLELLVW